MQLSPTDENAIRFLVCLTVLFAILGTARALAGNEGLIVALAFAIVALVFSAAGTPDVYETTMEDSLPVLKMSLLVALTLSFVGVLSANFAAIIAAVVFMICPIAYDFVRDMAFPNVPRTIPWSERRPGTRFLELLLNAILGAVISLIITWGLTGHP